MKICDSDFLRMQAAFMYVKGLNPETILGNLASVLTAYCVFPGNRKSGYCFLNVYALTSAILFNWRINSSLKLAIPPRKGDKAEKKETLIFEFELLDSKINACVFVLVS